MSQELPTVPPYLTPQQAERHWETLLTWLDAQPLPQAGGEFSDMAQRADDWKRKHAPTGDAGFALQFSPLRPTPTAHTDIEVQPVFALGNTVSNRFPGPDEGPERLRETQQMQPARGSRIVLPPEQAAKLDASTTRVWFSVQGQSIQAAVLRQQNLAQLIRHGRHIRRRSVELMVGGVILLLGSPFLIGLLAFVVPIGGFMALTVGSVILFGYGARFRRLAEFPLPGEPLSDRHRRRLERGSERPEGVERELEHYLRWRADERTA